MSYFNRLLRFTTSMRWLTVLIILLLSGLVFGPAAAAQEDIPTLTVLVETLKIRSGPDASYPAFDTFEQGTTRGIIGYNAKTGWWQVVSTFGSPGWVNGAEVAVNEAATLKFVAPASQPQAAVADSSVAAAGTIVFQTSAGGAIYAVDSAGTNLRYLTTGMDPAISPDGQQVAFVRWDGAEFGALYTINLDGSDERAVVGGIRQAKSPTWSPDGQAIIVSFQHGGLRDPAEICKEFDHDDGFRMPDNIGQVTKSRRSADGFVFCYIPKEDLQWGLRRIEVTTGQFEDLPHDLYSQSPTWNPALPWQVVYDGAKGLVSLDLNLGVSWLLTADLDDHTPLFSPDGSRLAVTYQQGSQSWDIQVLNSDGSGRVRLTQTAYVELVQQILSGQAPRSYHNISPAWSPDGSQIAFLTDRSGRWEIWVMSVDGSNQRPLFPPEALAGITFQYDGMNERMLSWR